MKKAILKGVKIGTIAGFISATIYTICFFVVAELVLPIPEPSAIMLFDVENMKMIVPILIGLSPIWLITPTLVGTLTGLGFGFILIKFKLSYKIYLVVCTLISAMIASVASILALIYVITTSYGNFFTDIFWNGHIQSVFLLITGLVFIPSILYVIVSYIVSRHLHKTLIQPVNA